MKIREIWINGEDVPVIIFVDRWDDGPLPFTEPPHTGSTLFIVPIGDDPVPSVKRLPIALERKESE